MSGRLVLMGSGETSPAMVTTHQEGLAAAGSDRVTLLDTPYGFQENADELTGRIEEFFRRRVGVETELVSLRHRNPTPVEVERFLAAVEAARYVFSGPGSPTFALEVWQQAGAAVALRRVLGNGGTVALASAAALTCGRATLPVYEIYKVGAEPHWREGLDLTGPLGLPMVVVPHWNNAEGGSHDTSRCFVGRRRFEALAAELETGVLGVDEHTAAVVDFAAGELQVVGVGGVTLWAEPVRALPSGERLPLADLAAGLGASPPPPRFHPPPVTIDLEAALAEGEVAAVVGAVAAAPPDELRPLLHRLAAEALAGRAERRRLQTLVAALLALRERKRAEGDFQLADALRQVLSDCGLQATDTPDGTVWEVR